MPIRVPALDDRSFDDLVEELLARIPAHVPEYTNPRLGDPGRTMIELFAWLTDTLLYRANLIPERQRLAFLRLLGIQMRPAVPARGLVSVFLDDDSLTSAVYLREQCILEGPVPFETTTPVTALPITAEAYYKRQATDMEQEQLTDVILGLREIFQIRGTATPYVTTPMFTGGAPEENGFDIVQRAVDRSIWLAILAPQSDLVGEVRATLGRNSSGGQQLLNVGVVLPRVLQQGSDLPDTLEEIGADSVSQGQASALHPLDPFYHAGRPSRIPHVWEISYVASDGTPRYLSLDIISDTTQGLTKDGVIRLQLPSEQFIGAPSNDVRTSMDAGVGPRPPRIDDPETAARLVAWLRLRPTAFLQSLSLGWLGINAVEIEQRQSVTGRVIGQSDGSIDQEFQLPGVSVQRETIQIQVEETGRGYQPWHLVDDLALLARHGRDVPAYSLDSEAGTIRFGDGVRGRIPEVGWRIRVARVRFGGGLAGNLPAGTLTKLSGRDPLGRPVTTQLKVQQSLPTGGGEDAESLTDAERRIPIMLRHRNRSVTADDYRQLARETPSVRLGRVEVLPRFKPHQRRTGVPGVVSVMALPHKDGYRPPNPRIDRHIIEAVHSYMDVRRPLATELYIIGCEYIPLGISVGVSLLDGFSGNGDGRTVAEGINPDAVHMAVREALFQYLWPLPTGGVSGKGWELSRPVRDRELEVVVARVSGVDAVSRVKLFTKQGDEWRRAQPSTNDAPVELPMRLWQLPELLEVVVVSSLEGAAPEAPDNLAGVPDPFASDSGIAIPVVPKIC